MNSNQEIVSALKDRRRKIVRLAFIVGAVVGVAIILGSLGFASNTIVIATLIICFVAALFINLKLWRCPSCNGHLGKLYFGLEEPKYCSVCGIKLLDN